VYVQWTCLSSSPSPAQAPATEQGATYGAFSPNTVAGADTGAELDVPCGCFFALHPATRAAVKSDRKTG